MLIAIVVLFLSGFLFLALHAFKLSKKAPQLESYSVAKRICKIAMQSVGICIVGFALILLMEKSYNVWMVGLLLIITGTANIVRLVRTKIISKENGHVLLQTFKFVLTFMNILTLLIGLFFILIVLNA